MHYAQLANWNQWNLELHHMPPCQIAKYKTGAHYDWHTDEFDEPYGLEAPERCSGLNRKLTVVLNLSRGTQYAGGDLEVRDSWGRAVKLSGGRRQGTVVVFPAYAMHRVTAVTSGVRWTVTGWAVGPNLR